MNTAALLAVLLASHHPQENLRPDGPSCDPRVLASFAGVDDALRQLQADVENQRGNKHDRARTLDDLATLRERTMRARVDACRAARDGDEVVIVTPPAPPPAPVVVVMDAPSHRALVNAVRREAFDDQRLSVLQLGTRDVCVTAGQAKELVQELDFSRPRLEAVRVLAARIVDRDAAYELLGALTFESDKRDAKDILNATATAPECRLPSRPESRRL